MRAYLYSFVPRVEKVLALIFGRVRDFNKEISCLRYKNMDTILSYANL